MPQPFTRNTFLLSAGGILLLIPAFFAQTPQRGPDIPDGGTREVLLSIFIPSLSRAPFAATVNTEWIRPLPDGTRITLKNHRLIARDKSGRIFQERRALVPEDSKQESVVTQTEISDPVAHEQYICVPQEHVVCQLEVFHWVELVSPAIASTAQKTPGSPGEESLGTQWIAGMEAVGTREIEVIPTGAIGNDSPILSKREYWYSRQLGLNVLSIREDPRFGTQKFELSDVTLGEPDAKLFTPPEGSKILDLRRPTEVEVPETPPSQ
jgi:hypothetical protein